MEGIVALLQMYQRKSDICWDEFERDSHTFEEAREAKNIALSELEERVNRYIDDRIEKWHERQPLVELTND